MFANLAFLRAVQLSSSIGIFIIGPVLFSRFERYQVLNYFKLNRAPIPVLLILVISLMIAITPLMEWLVTFNAEMKLPAALKDLEIWMRKQEDAAEQAMMMLIKMDSFSMYLFNLFMIAVIPAIGEELAFRGALQNILFRWFSNKHVVIWLTAAVFSAIHMQFYGFLPRMLLGGIFGYLMVYGKSIWYPILGHFINNGVAVTITYFYLKQGKSIENIDNETYFNPVYYLLSAAISLVLLPVLKKIVSQKSITTKSYE